MDVAMSLPDNIKHFQLMDPIYLNGILPRVVLSPTLQQIAPKADVLMDIFQYHRAKMCLLRIDSRPPLGYSQVIKIAITSTSADDESAFNRQGVTYNLAKCPTMYFLIPFCDRDFVKTRYGKWFKVLIEQVTPPVILSDVPEPFRFRPSFEVLELDYYVHKAAPNTAPPGQKSKEVPNSATRDQESTGRFEVGEASDAELIKQFECVKPIDYISILKERCDLYGEEVTYNFKRLVSPDNAPLYECVCMIGTRRFSAVEIGKKKAKRTASYIMLLALSDSVYQADIDPAAAEPSAPRNPMPPVAVASPGSLAAGQTVGTIGARVEVTEQNFVPINTVTVQPDAQSNDMLFLMRIHPGNFTSGGFESQAQVAYRNHVFSGPGMVNGKISYNTFKVTSAANAFQNARIIIAQIPSEYSRLQIQAMKAAELKQFPNREHFLHGTETIFNPQWVNKLPVITNHETDPSNTNGWLVAKILENSLVSTSTAPRLTYWVCANAVVYSMPRTPKALPAVTT